MTSGRVEATPDRLKAWKATCALLVQDCVEAENDSCDNGEQNGSYLRRFASSPLAQHFLHNDALTSCLGRKSRTYLKKELLEAAALVSRITKLCPPPSSGDDRTRKLIIYDLCCGKGLASLWLSVNTYPNATIYMIDNNRKTNREFLKDRQSFPNLHFEPLDLYSMELEDHIRQSASCCREDNARVILVGIHLCGDLSRRAIQLYQNTGADALLLSPCCAMRNISVKKRRPDSFGYNVPQLARRLKHKTPYELWCWMLWGYAKSISYGNDNSSNHGDNEDGRNVEGHTNETEPEETTVRTKRLQRLDLTVDTGMKTDKNGWLTMQQYSSVMIDALYVCRDVIDPHIQIKTKA